MAWYVADIVFADPDKQEETTFCESCCALFNAKSALAAYQKAIDWAKKKEEDNELVFAGIQNLWSVDDEEITDGTEVGGKFFEEESFWSKGIEQFPSPEEIPIMKMELNPNTPVGELFDVTSSEDVE